MDEKRITGIYRVAFFLMALTTLAGFAFAVGILMSTQVQAADKSSKPRKKKTRVVYPKKTKLDFEGLAIKGELKNPAEFYFKHRPQEKFDSLVKRRKNFHREMLRDAVVSK